MRAVCRGVARLSVGGMLFGHWFPPHALCSVLPFSGRRVGVATTPHTIVLFERIISYDKHSLPFSACDTKLFI